jgi:hypothetical protein
MDRIPISAGRRKTPTWRRGEVAEWLKATVLKTVDVERRPGVRIPPSPIDLAGIPQAIEMLAVSF